MKNPKNWIWILFFGSLWGMSEVWAGGFLYDNGVPHASIWLSAFAVFLLAVGRGVVKAPGSSTAMGTVATLFKLTNASPFFCHLLAIFMFGACFDAAASWLLKKGSVSLVRKSLTGVIGAFSGYVSFALAIRYIVRYEPWVEGGLPKIIHYVFVSGSLVALAAAVMFPFGLRLGADTEKAAVKRPGWSTAGAALVVVALWIVGRFIK